MAKDYKEQHLQTNAKSLRKNMTKEERRLWYDFLKTYPIRFYRQRIIQNYIVDFYCSKAKIVIELDGTQHYLKEGKTADFKRDTDLKQMGLLILRFSNREVNQEFDSVCQQIDKDVQTRIADNGD